jgi:hexosaminidase
LAVQEHFVKQLNRLPTVQTLLAASFIASTAFAAEKVALSWRLIANQSEGGYQAELTISNNSAHALADDWTIYFNSASKLLSESVSPQFELTHINGDFYSLRPGEQYEDIRPGDSAIISWRGTPWAINVSDAPSGFYIVRDERFGGPASPVSLPLEIGPFPSGDKLRRGENDLVPAVTPESRYKENESLTLLPPDTLVRVVPTPLELKQRPGTFAIRPATIIHYEPTLANEAAQLVTALEPLLGMKLKSMPMTGADSIAADGLVLRIGNVKNAAGETLGDEAYALRVNREGVEVIGSDPAGVYYGIQTLRALLPLAAYGKPIAGLEIDAVEIVDAPRFYYRGVHLDVARNFQRPETVKKLIDLMAFYKLNRLHWHLTDDEGWRLEIKQLPQLTGVGARRGHTLNESACLVPSHGSGPAPDDASSPGNGFYTQEELVDILRYAKDRHITVIPEIDLPGHARAAIKAMEARNLDAQGDDRTEAAILWMNPSTNRCKCGVIMLWTLAATTHTDLWIWS